ncbi:MAG: nucleotidyltransferase family protein [Bacteroidota bacterium]
MSNIGTIILAAGGSIRLGQPKQLLPYRNKTLLTSFINESVAVAAGPVLVVLGGYADEIINHLPSGIKYVINTNWHEGLGTSIRTGISSIMTETSKLDAVIVAVADQPFADRNVLGKLILRHRDTKKGIVASTYAKTIGTPALFDKRYFQQLLDLNGDEGAKKIFNLFQSDLETITFELGAIDIDTAEDYNNLKLLNAND